MESVRSRERPHPDLRRLARLLTVLLASCSVLHGGKHAGDDIPPPTEDLSLHVTNHNWSEVAIYAVNGSQRLRLGSVVTGAQVDLVVPRELVVVGEVRLLVHPIAGPRDYYSGPIPVHGGQEIDLRVENSLNQTSWSVY
jgi:hypothetical protein